MLTDDNEAYWTKRAPSYSDVNKDELETNQRVVWTSELDNEISAALPGMARKDISVLDIGCGPGFFSIILAQTGYRVTSIDYTQAMLDEARTNAGALSERIRFIRMDAENLGFADEEFDAIVTRNLTWNLPHPDAAYAEWLRVLKPGGILLNYDANWYAHLYDRELRRAYEADRLATESMGIKDEYAGTDIDAMEDIARRMPLSPIERPAWDESVLAALSPTLVEVDTQVWKRVFSAQERVNYASTPMFRIKVCK